MPEVEYKYVNRLLDKRSSAFVQVIFEKIGVTTGREIKRITTQVYTLAIENSKPRL